MNTVIVTQKIMIANLLPTHQSATSKVNCINEIDKYSISNAINDRIMSVNSVLYFLFNFMCLLLVYLFNILKIQTY